MSEARTILVRGPNWAGDLVMATPGFRALRRRFPHSHLALHLRPGLEELVHGAPWFDEVLPVASYGKGPQALFAEALSLRKQGFELGICLPDSFSSALLFRLAGIRSAGYRGQGRTPLLSLSVPAPRDSQGRPWVARERHVLGLMKAVGCEEGIEDTRLELFVAQEEEAEAAAALLREGISPEAILALLAPGASYGPSKLWPAEYFAEVGDAFARAGARVALVGTPSERELAGRVRAAMQMPAANLAGALSLGGLKAVMRRAAVLACNDAGARHVAVAFGVPCVVLMGPTALEKTNLNLEGVRVLTADVPCRPCYLRTCPIDHRCMREIQPQRVVDALLPTLLQQSGKGSHQACGTLGAPRALGSSW